jgi:hypothetical protein
VLFSFLLAFGSLSPDVFFFNELADVFTYEIDKDLDYFLPW